ncbi:hypothetical protein TWF506_000394 [Arthrobotrys conoides]|uniref:Uncharacterized protein n=1 Tax=Arthrobotrys conoides TaxID=74498 RepID=A0AAN8PQQ2_9PEZI
MCLTHTIHTPCQHTTTTRLQTCKLKRCKKIISTTLLQTLCPQCSYLENEAYAVIAVRALNYWKTCGEDTRKYRGFAKALMLRPVWRFEGQEYED